MSVFNDTDRLSFEICERILIVSICRKMCRNAVDGATARELYAAFKHFDADAALDVAVLRGEGAHFCAGADLKALAEGDARVLDEGGDFAPMGPTRLRLSKPVIAAVEGFAVAGGLELALWADVRVAARDARFGVFCRRFGVPLVDLGTVRLPRLIGHSRAMDLILTGREVTAEEAYDMGLVNRLAPQGGALEQALQLAKQVSAMPQTCMRNDRLSALEQWELTWDDAARNEVQRGLATLASGETQQGAAAFAAGEGRHGTSRARQE